MDYFDQQIENNINSIIDEYFETGKVNADKALIAILHWIRNGYKKQELHQSQVPLRGIFR